MADSFKTQYVGDLEKQDVVFGNESVFIVDDDNGKLIPVVILKEYLEEQMSYKAGDRYKLGVVGNYPGFVFGNSKQIRFMMTLDKPISAKQISVSCASLNVRGDKGYVISSEDMANYSPTVNFDKNAISITLTSPSALNVTTNTPVSVYGTIQVDFL